jgi:hypothetical protein
MQRGEKHSNELRSFRTDDAHSVHAHVKAAFTCSHITERRISEPKHHAMEAEMVAECTAAQMFNHGTRQGLPPCPRTLGWKKPPTLYCMGWIHSGRTDSEELCFHHHYHFSSHHLINVAVHEELSHLLRIRSHESWQL